MSDNLNSLDGMMSHNFLEYSSYVITDRAIPDAFDGLKPVQRRILYSLHNMDDGKFHKVANVIGQCMQFHPHGDSSIYQALVQLANKDFLIEKQGNFGNILTGDNASAARYIECRLTDLARKHIFNKKTCNFIDSYDGRKKEPILLPSKLPLLLMQGTEGIAVGMATNILSHNFVELLNGMINILRNKPVYLLPDFKQGGLIDASDYQDGKGKIILRAKIEKLNKKTLLIKEIPASTTSEKLIESIENAVKNNKLKISNISDYTAENIEIELSLPRNSDIDKTIDALYAYTYCQQKISSNITVIKDNKPQVITVTEILAYNCQNLVDLLKWELEIKLKEQEDLFFAKSLEQIFIENYLYKYLEKCKEISQMHQIIKEKLVKLTVHLNREISNDDIDVLLRLPIRKISLYDREKMNKELDAIIQLIAEFKNNLANLKTYSIAYIKDILKQIKKSYPRKTQISSFEKVDKKKIALSNVKFYFDKKLGYVGTKVDSKEPLVLTEFDKVIIFYKDGRYIIKDICEKEFVGRFYKIEKFDKNNIYSVLYQDAKTKAFYSKRCKINSFLINKEYTLFPVKAKLEMCDALADIELEFFNDKNSVVILNYQDVILRSSSARGIKVSTKKTTSFIKRKYGKKVSLVAESEELEEQEKEQITAFKAEKINFYTLSKIDEEIKEVVKEEKEVVKDDIVKEEKEVVKDDIVKEEKKVVKEEKEEKEDNNATTQEKRFLIDEDNDFTLM